MREQRGILENLKDETLKKRIQEAQNIGKTELREVFGSNI